MKYVFFIFAMVACSVTPDDLHAQTTTTPDRDLLRAAIMEEANALLEPRIAALEIDKSSLDRTLWFLQFLGGLGLLGGIAATFVVGKSLRDLRETVKIETQRAFEDTLRTETGLGGDLAKLLGDIKESTEQVEKIKGNLSGYVALAKTAEDASKFDPLVEYYELRADIKLRRPKTIALRYGMPVSTVETTDDSAFRQRAAVVFERLLASVADDERAGTNRLGSEDLFNAAAAASEADMDFVSIQFMAAAAKLGGDIPVEVEARLIRQQVSLSRITNQDAMSRLAKVLQRTTGFDVHLVGSEAFNIGLKAADPVEYAMLVVDNVSPDLYKNAYVLLNGARLMSMGSTQQDWDTGRDWAITGVNAFLAEPKSVRWYESTQGEIHALRRERPDITALFEKDVDAKLGQSQNAATPATGELLALMRKAINNTSKAKRPKAAPRKKPDDDTSDT
jgi:hypothetical protein